ncbi:MAG: hypothetical protein ACYTAQ_15075 [Planctomycetota bacterium]
MRNGFLFSTARVGALASIVGAPLVVIADAQPAQAAPQSSRPGILAARGPDAHQLPFLDFLNEFWQGAWGADFVPNGSRGSPARAGTRSSPGSSCPGSGSRRPLPRPALRSASSTS